MTTGDMMAFILASPEMREQRGQAAVIAYAACYADIRRGERLSALVDRYESGELPERDLVEQVMGEVLTADTKFLSDIEFCKSILKGNN